MKVLLIGAKSMNEHNDYSDFYKVVLQSVNGSLDLYSKIVIDDIQVI